jgi:hypothetical protein
MPSSGLAGSGARLIDLTSTAGAARREGSGRLAAILTGAGGRAIRIAAGGA